MRWKQFFTPVQSINSQQGRDMLNLPHDQVTLLDVRQAKEYKQSHLPGAKLIPLPELPGRLNELDPAKKILVY